MIADGIMVIAFHYVEKGMKAEEKMREMQANHEKDKAHEQEKVSDRAQRAAIRAEQKARTVNKNKVGGNSKPTAPIHQPKKQV